VKYLEKRGFTHVKHMCERYDLMASLMGDYKYRLVIPFYMNSRVVGWTGRAIVKALLRYKSNHDKNMRPHTIFNHDHCLSGGKLLVICEGPLDAIKVDWYGHLDHIHSCALLGLHLTAGKVHILNQLSTRYDQVRVMLDRGEEGRALRIISRLRGNVHLGTLPPGVKDPGDLGESEVLKIMTWNTQI
jgi:hypothetical protein